MQQNFAESLEHYIRVASDMPTICLRVASDNMIKNNQNEPIRGFCKKTFKKFAYSKKKQYLCARF